MALRIGRYLGTRPESWLNMQAAVDLWELERENAALYQGIQPAARKAA